MRIDFSGEAHDTFLNIINNTLRGVFRRHPSDNWGYVVGLVMVERDAKKYFDEEMGGDPQQPHEVLEKDNWHGRSGRWVIDVTVEGSTDGEWLMCRLWSDEDAEPTGPIIEVPFSYIEVIYVY
jgi:hypothetical protein